MNRRLRITALLIALVLIVSALSACGTAQSLEIRLDVQQGVKNMDPQFATDTLGCTIIANTMEGLLRFNAQGELIPAGAESYSTERGGLKYVFTLRQDAEWSNGDPVTANDYVFAFQRIFNREVPSPYAEHYSAIQGAQQVLSGEYPPERLGVRATTDYTLEITLERPSPAFLERLADTAATPCNRKFFDSTRARYGLGSGYLIYNGPYKVQSWNNDKSIALRPNGSYYQPPVCPGVIIYTSRIVPPGGDVKAKSHLELFNEGKDDVYVATLAEMETLEKNGATRMEIKNRAWQLAVNTRDGMLKNEKLRRAVMMSLDSGEYPSRVDEMYGVAHSLIPQSARPGGLLPPSLLPYNRQWARDAAAEAYAEAGETPGEQPLTLIIPNDAGLAGLGSYMQKQWKDTLSIYVNMETLSQEELKKRLESGEFSLAIIQVEAAETDPSGTLGIFTGSSPRNIYGWQSDTLDEVLRQAEGRGGGENALRQYEDAEQIIIDSAVAAPLLTQSSYYAFGKGVSGVELILGRLDFRNAVRVG